MSHHEADANKISLVLELLTEHGFDRLAEAIQILLNEAMLIERSESLNAAPYERAEARADLGSSSRSLERAQSERGSIKRCGLPLSAHSERFGAVRANAGALSELDIMQRDDDVARRQGLGDYVSPEVVGRMLHAQLFIEDPTHYVDEAVAREAFTNRNSSAAGIHLINEWPLGETHLSTALLAALGLCAGGLLDEADPVLFESIELRRATKDAVRLG